MVKLNPLVEVRVTDRYYDHVLKRKNSITIQKEIEYTLWSFYLGEGNRPCYIITEGKEHIMIGEQELNLKMAQNVKLNPPEKKIIEKMAKDQGIDLKTSSDDLTGNPRRVTKASEELWSEIIGLNKDDPIFFEIDTPIAENDFDFIINDWEPAEFNNLIRTYLTDGMEVDEELIYVGRALLPQFSSIKEHKRLMPFSPHGLIFTNPKVGKTSMMEKISKRLDRTRISRLFGFATSDKVIRGELDNMTEALSLDEVNEEKDEGIFNQILTFEETGVTRVAVGKETITCKGLSPIYYMGNPLMVFTKDDHGLSQDPSTFLLLAFGDMLRKLTNNYQAFGSRKAFVLFGKGFKKAKGMAIDADEFNEKHALVRMMILRLKPKMEKIFKMDQVQTWLKTDIGYDYKSNIRKLADTLTMSKPTMEFWQGQTSSFRHMKGFAFRQAIMDNIKEILTDNLNIDNFIEDMENNLDKVIKMNLASCNRMISAQDSNTIAQYRWNMIQSLKQKYLKHFMMGLINYVSDNDSRQIHSVSNPQDDPKDPVTPNFVSKDVNLINVHDISSSYSQLMKSKELEGNNYGVWSRVVSKMDSYSSISRSLQHILDIYFFKINNVLHIKINCPIQQLKDLEKFI